MTERSTAVDFPTGALPSPAVADPPTFGGLTRQFFRIGMLSFGGPAGQIALMHREIVEERRWVEEDAYLRALNLCHLLPGPEAQQLATWIGWRLHGFTGGLVAGLLFILPGAVVMLALSFAYAAAAGLGWFAALFLGIKAAVLAIVASALIRIGRKALRTPLQRALALIAFAALFLFALPFPLVVLGAGAIGWWVARADPAALALKPHAGTAPTADARPWAATLRTILFWLALWAIPFALIAATLGTDHVLWDIAAFFSQLAIVTFGGAYAVLAYMAQEAVTGMGWLTAAEMADGLGLAETTPGPLILVTQFVGTLAAMRAALPLDPVLAGLLGALIVLWVTFVPCFLWIFALAPWMDRLERVQGLQGGLAAITAAVVGVIANLSLWFALHVLFARLERVTAGPVRVELPDPASFDAAAAAIAAAAFILKFALRRGPLITLAVCAALGLATTAISG